MIVEIHDHRSTTFDNHQAPESESQMKRIVMKPTAESIWTDISLLSEEWGVPWTETISLEVEAQILVSHDSIESLCHTQTKGIYRLLQRNRFV